MTAIAVAAILAVQERVSLKAGLERADQILDHEARDARAGVDRRQDEQRLEQNGEMIPEGHQRLAADGARENFAPCRRRASARRRCATESSLSPTLAAASFSISGVTAKPHPEMAAAADSGVVPITAAGLFIAK